MTDLTETLARVLARSRGRAVPSRMTSALATDGRNTIGIATIKIVTEEQIQAIAYGSPDHDPEVIARLNPLSRDVTDLLPFAVFMNEWAENVLASSGEGRIWIPHSKTIEALDILGHRYWRNQTAPDEIVKMGEVCRIIAHEALFPGQQLIADAQHTIASHVTTGLTPLEEGHLGALLPWLDPNSTDTLRESRERIRIPASGVLPNTPDRPWDDQVDGWRRSAKSSQGAAKALLESQIADLLTRSVLEEWDLMTQARQRFFELGLPATGLEERVKASRERMQYAFETGHYPARQPHRLVLELEAMEASQIRTDHGGLVVDESLRDEAVKAGNVVRGHISAVLQPRPRFKPCTISVSSEQAIIRMRLDDKIKISGSNVSGIIRNIGRDAAGHTVLEIEIETGVRSQDVLVLGGDVELLETPYTLVRHKVYSEVGNRQPWAFFANEQPVLPMAERPARNPLQIAEESRRLP